MMAMFQGALRGSIRQQAFASSFSPFDLLWFGLAAFTALRIGSGTARESD